MISADWTPHRREDGELIGWIRPEGDAWVGVDLLGRDATAVGEWLDVEEALEKRGLAWLADPWMLERSGGEPLRVRIVEATPEQVVVKEEDFGDVARGTPRHELPWPAPAALRPLRPGDPDGFVF